MQHEQQETEQAGNMGVRQAEWVLYADAIKTTPADHFASGESGDGTTVERREESGESFRYV